MKKSFVLILLALCVITASQAQNFIYPKVGVTLQGFQSDEQSKASGRTGFTAGIGYSVAISGVFSLQPELYFTQKGGEYKFSGPVGDGLTETTTLDIRLNYLEIPMLAKATFGSDKFKYYVTLGPSISYALGGSNRFNDVYSFGPEVVDSYSATGDIRFGSEPEVHDPEDLYVKHRLDIGAQLGGGAILFKKVMIDVRYGMNFTKLESNYNTKNRGAMITVGVPLYIFNL